MKISPFLSHHINLTEKIMDKVVSGKGEEQPKADDGVKISDESKRKRIMGQVIESIAGDDGEKKGS